MICFFEKKSCTCNHPQIYEVFQKGNNKKKYVFTVLSSMKENLCLHLCPKFLADVLRIHGECVVNLYIVELILEIKGVFFLLITMLSTLKKSEVLP